MEIASEGIIGNKLIVKFNFSESDLGMAPANKFVLRVT